MEEVKIKLLHPEITGDCSESILSELKKLNDIKDKMYSLSEERFKLEREYDKRHGAISSMVGIVFDYIIEDKKIDHAVNKSNIIFKNVNGGSKSW